MAETRRPAMRYDKLFDEGMARKYARRIEGGRYKEYARATVYQPFAVRFKDPIAYLTPEEAELERTARVRHEDELRRPRMSARDPSMPVVSPEDRTAALRRVATTPVSPADVAARGYRRRVFDSDEDAFTRAMAAAGLLTLAGAETAATLGAGRAPGPVAFGRSREIGVPSSPRHSGGYIVAMAGKREANPRTLRPFRPPEAMYIDYMHQRLPNGESVVRPVPYPIDPLSEAVVGAGAHRTPWAPVARTLEEPGAREAVSTPTVPMPVDNTANAFKSLRLEGLLNDTTRAYYDQLQNDFYQERGRFMDPQAAALRTIWKTGSMSRDDVYRRAVQLRLDRDEAPSVVEWRGVRDYSARRGQAQE